MKKNFVQDVIPPKKSIRNVEIPRRNTYRENVDIEDIPKIKKKPTDEFSRAVPIKQNPIRIDPMAKKSTFLDEHEGSNIPPSINYNYSYNEEKPKKRFGKFLGLVVLIAAVVFGGSFFFQSAKITITPKQDTKSLNNNFSAKKDIPTNLNELGFQIVKISKDVEKIVEATGEEMVERKARGMIVIYNNYSATAQQLVATTRFETPEGLIYRLVNPVTVPGRQTVSGKVTPGSVEAVVEADKTGTSYNIGMKDFTIPGFKGTPRYQGFYARSKTEMTGGFSGMQKIVSSQNLQLAESELDSSLKELIMSEVSSEIPSNFIMYEGGLFYKTEPIAQASSTGNTVVLKKRGTANVIIFDKTSLTNEIINKIAPELSGENLKISNLESLKLSFIENTTFNPELSAVANFKLEGSVNIIWNIDENNLKNSLLGLSRASARESISNYGNIVEAWVETRPFWNRKIPKDAEKVTIINTLGE